MTCRYLAGLAADRARGAVTSPQRAAFMSSTCPCADCKAWRQSRRDEQVRGLTRAFLDEQAALTRAALDAQTEREEIAADGGVTVSGRASA